MTPTKLLIGQIAVVFAIILAGIWFATQWAAAALAYQPELGSPWALIDGIPVYRPWAIFLWWYHFDAYAPHVFDRAGAIAGASGFVGCGAAVAGSLWRARQRRNVTTYGSAHWASVREAGAADLFSNGGVFLGRLDFFETSLAFLAGYGVRAFLIAQSLNQIEKAYGEHNAILDNCHVRVAFATNDERTAKRISDALGTATEQRAMRNYAGHRLAPWLAHVMVSRQETARALLTPGEVMQLPPTDELVFVAGHAPVRAKKLRYYEDRTFKARILAAPALGGEAYADLPKARPDDWQGHVRGIDARLGTVADETREETTGGLEQVRHPAHEVDQAAPVDLTPADVLGLGEDDSDTAADKRAMDQAQAATRTVYAIDSGSARPDDLQLDF
ncbi:MAG: type IV secretory system conjugative DNA transfer family protein [Sphingobium sp.]|nr:type IV secretory system conjugative DNA transfer family protein [Sphingobium sp.]